MPPTLGLNETSFKQATDDVDDYTALYPRMNSSKPPL
jgi:hypothetical protein